MNVPLDWALHESIDYYDVTINRGGAIPGRTYTSRLRSEQAAATRNRVVEAAAVLFATEGYAATTLARIAAAADVSLETVQAHGPKRRLLTAAVQLGTFGREDAGSILDTPEVRALAEAASPSEFAAASAQLMTGFNARTAGLWRAFGSAAADDAVVDAEWSSVMAAIRSDVAEVVAMVESRGWLRTDVDSVELAISLWILIGAETFEKLTVRVGWTQSRYQAWLARQIAELLFPPSLARGVSEA